MKTSKLIKRLQQLLAKEGDLEVGVYTPAYGNYACPIDNVRAGFNGTLEEKNFGVVEDEDEDYIIVIFGKRH